ncbi:MAG: DNA recombination protein RmuC [Candidatus Cloacimonadales bacterium]|nr:DNA recombination protein RmuC [Candidatus Cloacimonadota bacterium]MDD3501188.1 DNA recombination protein RmuC [Candidatus Cloacimonadota bacterium]MDX9976885.1 DNA recombination protein RmuC [Candidatus Cloacimonadales bacterium]
MDYLSIFSFVNFVLILVLLILFLFKKSKIEVNDEKINNVLKDELSRLKKELGDQNSNLRTELNTSLQSVRQEVNENLSDNLEQFRRLVSEQLENLIKQNTQNNETITQKQDKIRLETESKLKDTNDSLANAFESLKTRLNNSLSEFGEKQRLYSEEYIKKHEEIKKDTQNNMESVRKTTEDKLELMRKATEDKLEMVRKTVEDKLSTMQNNNEKKLEEMRKTVDQKLQETLDKKLSESFNTVSTQLQEVYKGLGEMKNLATDVGGLKKALTNVSTRGAYGEIQLHRIIEDFLSPAQYEKNANVKPNSQERVEFAIRLPGKDDDSEVLLPIDSKYHLEPYEKLMLAMDSGDKTDIDKCRKAFESSILESAKKISSKYINPPKTTNFAILFLPSESVFAEALRNYPLINQIYTDYNISISGPTTLVSLINSLEMGFKTLTIEKKSKDIWTVLSAVKRQFSLFGEVLEKTQKKLHGASSDLESLVGVRTKRIQNALQKVEELPIKDDRRDPKLQELLIDITGQNEASQISNESNDIPENKVINSTNDNDEDMDDRDEDYKYIEYNEQDDNYDYS